MIVPPLAINVHATQIYEPVKVALLRSLVGMMVLAWVVLTVEEHVRRPGGRVIDRSRSWLALPLVVPVLLFAASYVVSTLFSLNPSKSLWGSFSRLQGTYSTLCYLALFGLVAEHLRTRQQIDRLVTAILLGSVPVAAYGISEHFGLGPLVTTSTAIVGTLGSSLFLSSYLVLVIPLVLARVFESLAPGVTDGAMWNGAVRNGAVQKPRPVAALLYGVLLAVHAAVILVSGSRGPAVGLAGAGLVAVALALPRVRHWLWAPWLGAAVGGVLLLVAMNSSGPMLSPLFEPLRSAPYVERFSSVIRTDGPTVRVRTLLWDSATELLLRTTPLGIPGDTLAPPDRHHPIRPLVGYGPENQPTAMTVVFPPEIALIEGRRARPDRAHNETIDLAVTTGLLGVLAYYVLMFGLLAYALELLGWVGGASRRRRTIVTLATCGVLAVVVAALLDRTGSPLTFVGLALPFGVVAGVLVHVVWRCARDGRTSG
ncbi:MAG: O-antigen ligase family protein [Acidobacteria bacterium]|nr:O-antigen ligase family protein [Acidobacteriota bacterium]